MQFLGDTVALSRLQFALTAIFHMLWPVLTTGMAIYLIIIEGLWLKTRNLQYYHHARFWSKLYVLNFGIGVASGLPMAFQFGLNWAPFSESVGDFFGTVLGFEGDKMMQVLKEKLAKASKSKSEKALVDLTTYFVTELAKDASLQKK
ncbi:MAG: cytochrome ubiquinol oxidase subunit I, partial [Leptodesmis sp.]|uniref:cytochrome ubiquinol oxidase subunit I n=1 Tax=Leptodesmis sp. TaxID=3100501 RepID=UPI003D0CAB84